MKKLPIHRAASPLSGPGTLTDQEGRDQVADGVGLSPGRSLDAATTLPKFPVNVKYFNSTLNRS